MASPIFKKGDIPAAGVFELHAMMLCTGRYSDLTIICKGRAFRVHRNIICLQSKPLAGCVDGEFMEGITGEIKLDDDEPEIVDKMIKYLYERDYHDGPTIPESEDEGDVVVAGPLVANTKLYIIADKYDIPSLKELAKLKDKTTVAAEWNDLSFAASLRLMCEETAELDRALKDVAICAASSHPKELLDRGEFGTLCKENGEIGFDLLKLPYAGQQNGPIAASAESIICPHCGSDQYRLETGFSIMKDKCRKSCKPANLRINYYCRRI